jgi:16S rRNA processing protein RimM
LPKKPSISRPLTPALSPHTRRGSGASARADLVLVGRFGAPHGLKGEVRLQSFTQDPAAIATYGALTDRAGSRKFAIKSLRPGGKGIFVATVAGVADRTAAEQLTNVELHAERANMPAEDEDEFYVTDLIGLAAVTPAGETLGEVLDVVNYGAGDLIEVKPVAGGETLLFPFTRAVVPAIDKAARKVIIAPPVEVDGEARGGRELD